MMTFELKLEKPNVSRAWISAATMGVAYFVGMSPHSLRPGPPPSSRPTDSDPTLPQAA